MNGKVNRFSNGFDHSRLGATCQQPGGLKIDSILNLGLHLTDQIVHADNALAILRRQFLIRIRLAVDAGDRQLQDVEHLVPQRRHHAHNVLAPDRAHANASGFVSTRYKPPDTLLAFFDGLG